MSLFVLERNNINSKLDERDTGNINVPQFYKSVK